MNLKICALIFGLLLIFQCDVFDPIEDNRTSDILIPDENAIVDLRTAEAAMAGLYYSFKTIFDSNQGRGVETYVHVIGALLGVETEIESTAFGSDEFLFSNHQILPTNTLNRIFYQNCYRNINIANNILDKVSALEGVETQEKNRILASARFIRALVYSYLLQYYTPFYDPASSYGLVLKTGHTTWENLFIETPRNTVAETYTQILADLDEAIAQANPYQNGLLANRLAAKALKARMLLYRGNEADWDTILKLCRDVINDPRTALVPTYAELFSYNQFSSNTETLFALDFSQNPQDGNQTGQAWGVFSGILLSQTYTTELAMDPRQATIVGFHLWLGFPVNAKYFNPLDSSRLAGGDSTSYFIRLAEIYLIAAEVLARQGAAADQVTAYLHPIQDRAQVPRTTAATSAELLEAIRIEKLKELGTENGIPWIDMVRFAVLDALDISSYKPAVVRPTQYILPIPESSVQQGVVEQNPGY